MNLVLEVNAFSVCEGAPENPGKALCRPRQCVTSWFGVNVARRHQSGCFCATILFREQFSGSVSWTYTSFPNKREILSKHYTLHNNQPNTI